MGGALSLVALIIEVVYWAKTRDDSLLFYALVLTTLSVVIPHGVSYYPKRT